MVDMNIWENFIMLRFKNIDSYYCSDYYKGTGCVFIDGFIVIKWFYKNNIVKRSSHDKI